MKNRLYFKTLAVGIIVLFICFGIHPVFAFEAKTNISDNEFFLTKNKTHRQYWKTIIFLPFFGIINDLTEDNENYYFTGRIIIGLGISYSSLDGFTLLPEFIINGGCQILKDDFYGTINEKYIIGFLFSIYEFPNIKF